MINFSEIANYSLRKEKSLFLIILVIFFSCSNDDTKKEEQENPRKDTILAQIAFDTVRNKTIESKIFVDSSKLIKGFDDIYFGTPEGALSSKDYYSIDGNGFILTSSWYDTNHGLFEFTLTSTDEQKQFNLKEYEENICKIINSKYGRPIQRNDRKKDLTIDILRSKTEEENKEDYEAKRPKDWGDTIYKYSWPYNRIKIDFGYVISYKPAFYKTKAIGASKYGLEELKIDTDKIRNYNKIYTYVLIFKYPPYYIEQIKIEKERLKKESNKF
jgi:hypothetical protein